MEVVVVELHTYTCCSIQPASSVCVCVYSAHTTPKLQCTRCTVLGLEGTRKGVLCVCVCVCREKEILITV